MHKSIRTRIWVGAVVFLAVLAFFYPFVVPPQSPEDMAIAAKRHRLSMPDFSSFHRISEKKQAFFGYLKPEVEKQNQAILLKRSELLSIREQMRRGATVSSADIDDVLEICEEYDVECENVDVKTLDKLLLKVDIIPYELVLVQAANESAWGTSRFARQGYNFFGLWCFRKGCGFVPRQRDDDSNHEVAKFSSLEHGVSRYLNNLNRHYAYREMRNIRAALRDTQQPITAEALIEGLLSYSERGQAYVEELQSMIRVNRKYM